MHNLLLESIAEHVRLTSEEQETIRKYFMPRRLKKRQYVLQEGTVCDRFSFVAKGTLVSYSIDEKGNEHALSFAFEGCWAVDWASLYNHEPSGLTIQTLEASELLQIRAEYQELLFALVPAYERYIRINHQQTCVALQKRLEGSLGLSADEKYDRLVKQSPALATKVPLNLIASYLGVSKETLCRIRKHRFAYS
jgi:CRP-like cAMP-binding protein